MFQKQYHQLCFLGLIWLTGSTLLVGCINRPVASEETIMGLVPTTATDLQVFHNIDSDESMLRFDFDEKAAPTLLAACTAIDEMPPIPVTVVPDDPHWWPAEMATVADQLFACPEDYGYLAVDLDAMRAYIWRINAAYTSSTQ